MEAAAFGLPCIASDIIGCREIVSDGVNGLLVAPKNSQALAMAITTLIEDEGKYRAMRARARPSVEKKYCQRRYLEGLKNEYFKLLGEISVPSLSDQGSVRPS